MSDPLISAIARSCSTCKWHRGGSEDRCTHPTAVANGSTLALVYGFTDCRRERATFNFPWTKSCGRKGKLWEHQGTEAAPEKMAYKVTGGTSQYTVTASQFMQQEVARQQAQARMQEAIARAYQAGVSAPPPPAQPDPNYPWSVYLSKNEAP